jgi:hypothetical protein
MHGTAERTAIPVLLRSLVTVPPVRTAIDPKAVAAACLARAGSLAQAAGDRREAERVVRIIAESYGEPDYAFYLNQAQGQTRDLEHSPRASAVGSAIAGRRAAPIAYQAQERMK